MIVQVSAADGHREDKHALRAVIESGRKAQPMAVESELPQAHLGDDLSRQRVTNSNHRAHAGGFYFSKKFDRRP